MKVPFGIAALLAISYSALAGSVAGHWDGTIKFDNISIPFRIDFSGSGSQIEASFFNGEERVTSTSGRLEGNKLTVNFDHDATKLEAKLTDGVLKGAYGSARSGSHEFEARPHREATFASG